MASIFNNLTHFRQELLQYLNKFSSFTFPFHFFCTLDPISSFTVIVTQPSWLLISSYCQVSLYKPSLRQINQLKKLCCTTCAVDDDCQMGPLHIVYAVEITYSKKNSRLNLSLLSLNLSCKQEAKFRIEKSCTELYSETLRLPHRATCILSPRISYSFVGHFIYPTSTK